MLVTDFDYDLPQELIAQHPMEPRDHSRLLVVDKKTGEIEHKHFYDLVNYLKPGDVLVFNDTRVIPARLHGTKDTGAHVEVFLLTRRDATDWEVLVRPGKKLQVGAKINFSDELSCEVIEHTDFGGRVVRFKYDGIFEEILDRLGETPLPPYITAPLEDKERYQTVYNRERGSAAAPTAGLHFTKELLQKIKDIGCEEVFVTLHVGLGTFRPVSEAKIEDHKMHKEFYTVSQEAADAVNKAKAEGRQFFESNPQDNYPDALDKYRKLMNEKQWEVGEDEEELFEYAMHPAQYEAYKSGKAKQDFLEDVEKRRAERDKSPLDDAKPKTLTVQVDGQAYRVTVAYGDIDLPASATEKVTAPPVGEGQDVPAPLEGKFFLTKNAQETPLKVGDKVKSGDLLCYIEAMKTYNAIRADFDGTVVAICVNPGDSVSEDDVLMKIG